jgi:hypothetical protein
MPTPSREADQAVCEGKDAIELSYVAAKMGEKSD